MRWRPRPGWPEIEAALDRIGVADRTALVLQEVAGLSPTQVQDVTGRGRRAVGSGPGGRPAPGGRDVPRRPAADRGDDRGLRRRRGAGCGRPPSPAASLSWPSAGVVTAVVLRADDPPADDASETFDPVTSRTYDNPSPLAWYADGTLYLPHSQVDLRDVRDFAQWDDGAVYLDLRGNLVTVTRDGDRRLIATLDPDGYVPRSRTPRTEWSGSIPTVPCSSTTTSTPGRGSARSTWTRVRCASSPSRMRARTSPPESSCSRSTSMRATSTWSPTGGCRVSCSATGASC